MGRFLDKQSWRGVGRLRTQHLILEPLCRHCKARGLLVVGTQVDHIIARDDGGDEYDHANLQTLCDDCHGRKTREEHGARVRVAFDINGNPINSTHHWNKPTTCVVLMLCCVVLCCVGG